MRPTAEQSHSNADSGGRFETMTNTRDTRMVMIVDSEPAQQRFLAALASRGGWRSVIAPDTDTALAKPGTQERSEEHKSELQSILRISYVASCSKKKTQKINRQPI